VTRFKSA